jgi:hypothetical protein
MYAFGHCPLLHILHSLFGEDKKKKDVPPRILPIDHKRLVFHTTFLYGQRAILEGVPHSDFWATPPRYKIPITYDIKYLLL